MNIKDLLLLIIVFPLCLGSCSSSEDNEPNEVKKEVVSTEELCHKWNVVSTDITFTEVANSGVRVTDKATVQHTFSGANFHEIIPWIGASLNIKLESPFWLQLSGVQGGIKLLDGSVLTGFEMSLPDQFTMFYRGYSNERILEEKATWKWKKQEDGTISTQWENTPNFDNGTITIAKENGKLTLTMQSGVTRDIMNKGDGSVIYFRVTMKFTLEKAE